MRDGVARREPLVLIVKEKRMVEVAENSSGKKKKKSLKLKILKLVLWGILPHKLIVLFGVCVSIYSGG